MNNGEGRPYIQHFVAAIEEAIAAHKKHQNDAILDFVADAQPQHSPLLPNRESPRSTKSYYKTPRRVEEKPMHRGPCCVACGMRGPHICKPFVVDVPDSK